MLHRIRDSFWREGRRATVFDGNDGPVYHVTGEAFAWGEPLVLGVVDGEELLRIDQMLLDGGPCYQLRRDGTLESELHRGDGWQRLRRAVPVLGDGPLMLEGSFWQHEYRIHDGSRQLARISKNYWGWSDSYGVGIEEGIDPALVIGLCLSIDMLLVEVDAP